MNPLIYWSSTSAVALVLALSALSYTFHQGTIEGIRELGFPDFFRVQLAILKTLAVLALLAPQVPLQFKEWAYAGASFFFITAIVAHVAHRDSHFITMLNLLFLVLLAISNVYLHRLSS